jgi:hypothetical protein
MSQPGNRAFAFATIWSTSFCCSSRVSFIVSVRLAGIEVVGRDFEPFCVFNFGQVHIDDATNVKEAAVAAGAHGLIDAHPMTRQQARDTGTRNETALGFHAPYSDVRPPCSNALSHEAGTLKLEQELGKPGTVTGVGPKHSWKTLPLAAQSGEFQRVRVVSWSPAARPLYFKAVLGVIAKALLRVAAG